MKCLRICLVGLFVLAGSLCHAGTLAYSNLGPAGTNYTGWYSIGTGHTPEFGFSPTSTVTLTTIDIALTQYITVGTGDLTIGLYNADNNWAVGALLESWTIPYASLPAYNPSTDTTQVVISLAATGNVALTQGNNYWLAASDDESTMAVWCLAWPDSPNATGPYEHEFDDATIIRTAWQGAFDVVGAEGSLPSSVPEPSTLLLCAATLLMAGVVRTRRKGIRVCRFRKIVS
jgi:hypothetical protein